VEKVEAKQEQAMLVLLLELEISSKIQEDPVV
jgi:hypothetical protein